MQDEARGWLQARGSDQWSTVRHTDPESPRSLEAGIRRGEVWVWRSGPDIVATATLDDFADPEFWTADDAPKDALYIHRMIVSRAAAGNDLGSGILDWATRRTVRAGRHWVRLDAWRSNAALHAYYLRHGFERVRTVDLPHRGSGALFQRPASS
jgi:GNAT superfamily N-acetyltransferase